MMGGRGDAARCWCQFFRLPNGDYQASSVEGRKGALREQLAGALSPGVLAYADSGEPIGWCGLGPRRNYQRLARSEIGKATRDAAGLWSVVCFVVSVQHRRQGITERLLAAAIDLARSNGAAAIEAYPVDVTVALRISSAALHPGPLSVYLRAGFHEVARPKPSRPIVRLSLS